MRSLPVCVALLSVAACSKTDYASNPAPAPITHSFDFRLQDIFSGNTRPDTPIDLQAPPGDDRVFIAERAGRIRVVQNGTLLTTPFLDLNASSSRVYTDGEAGLLSFAFDPQFATN